VVSTMTATSTPTSRPATQSRFTFLVDRGLPAGVYRAEIWCDLVTTMTPITTTFDFTVAETSI
jgi:hypothetical protein